MKMDYSQPGKVIFSMEDYIDRIVSETPDELLKGPCSTPAANHLFNVNEDSEPLDKIRAEKYHHLTAMILYLAKKTRPDVQTATAFLTTRVQSPSLDDWKKLGRCVRYLGVTKSLPLTLEADDRGIIRWWVDASYAVHPNMRSHTGATMSLGKGHPYSMSSKQKINTRSSTEAELVGVNDAMSLIVWTKLFLEAQGIKVTDNVLYQDNQSAILLENNGKRSSSKKTRHIEIRYFFVTDNILRKQLRTEYLSTDLMTADALTKPLQGAKFRQFRRELLNLDMDFVDYKSADVATNVKTNQVETSSAERQECVAIAGSDKDQDQDQTDKCANHVSVSWKNRVEARAGRSYLASAQRPLVRS